MQGKRKLNSASEVSFVIHVTIKIVGGEERCVTTLITAAKDTTDHRDGCYFWDI